MKQREYNHDRRTNCRVGVGINRSISNDERAYHQMTPKLFLICGIAASLIYVGTDIAAGFLYPGFSFRDQFVSELFAIGATTSRLVVPLFTLSSMLVIAFSIGVWLSSERNRALRYVAVMLAANAIDALALRNLFPMHMRGAAQTFTDSMHFILAINPFVVLGIVAGAIAFENWFRLYSIATISIVAASAIPAFQYASQLGANLDTTPWLGLCERISQYAHQLWQALLALTLLAQRAEISAR